MGSLIGKVNRQVTLNLKWTYRMILTVYLVKKILFSL